MNLKFTTFAIVSLLSLVGCKVDTFERTTRTPMGTRTVQQVDGPGGRDTRITEDSKTEFDECKSESAPQIGSRNARWDCHMQSSGAGMMGVGGMGMMPMGVGPGMLYETPGTGAAYGMNNAAPLPFGAPTQPSAPAPAAPTTSNKVQDAQKTVINDLTRRNKALQQENDTLKKGQAPEKK